MILERGSERPNTDNVRIRIAERNHRAAKAIGPRIPEWAGQHRFNFRPVNQAEIQQPAQLMQRRIHRTDDGAASERKPIQCRFPHLDSLHTTD